MSKGDHRRNEDGNKVRANWPDLSRKDETKKPPPPEKPKQP